MSDKTFVVQGIAFKSEAAAKEATNEVNGVEYLKKRMNFNSPKSVLATYSMVIEKKLFKTTIGYSFLIDTRNKLIEAGIDEADIPNIVLDDTSIRTIKVKKSEKEVDSVYKGRFINMIILNIVLLIAVILFAIIANNSENVNVINYKNRIDSQYKNIEQNLSEWSQELKNKEDNLNQLEEELNSKQ